MITPATRAERFWDHLMELGTLTDPAQPWTRRSFSPQFAAGRDWLRARFEEAGLATRVDSAGNLIGRLEGSQAGARCIMIGSHSDTVPGGGRFDGVAGVIAALEVAATLRDRGVRLRHALEVVDFLAEEPSEFGLSCIGSRGIAGQLDAAMLDLCSPTGERLASALRRAGGDPDRVSAARRDDIAACFELHIEQGAVLESKGIDLGIVSAIVGITRYRVTFQGQAAHAGTTPMAMRRDALAAAALFMSDLRTAALERADGPAYFVATAGRIEVSPNAANVVPGRVVLTLDLRSDDAQAMQAFVEGLPALAAQAASRVGVEVAAIEGLSATRPTPCSRALMDHLRRAGEALGYSSMDMISGAGHDCAFVAQVAPAAMLFVPSRAGMSHCPEEWTEPAQFAAGVAALYRAVCEFDASE